MATLPSSQTQTPPEQQVSDDSTPQTSAGQVSDDSQPQTSPGLNEEILSTPSRKGLAAVSRSLRDFSPESVRKNLGPDLKQAKKVPFSHFLHYALSLVGAVPNRKNGTSPELIEKELKTCLVPIIDAVNKNKDKLIKINRQLDKYLAQHPEPNRYEPFVHATNMALTLLQNIEIGEATVIRNPSSDDTLVFLRHDPSKVISQHPTMVNSLEYPIKVDIKDKGQRSERKPDVICASKKNIIPIYSKEDNTIGSSMEKLFERVAQSPPSNKALEWKHHYSCVELKLSKTDIQIARPQYNEEYIKAPLTEFEYTTNAKTIARGPANTVSAIQSSQGSQSNEPNAVSTAAKSEDTEVIVLAKCAEQCADDASEMFYNTFGRNDVTNMAITDHILRIWYFDHECPIKTSGLNFIQDLPYFLLLLYALQRFSPSDWGYIDELNPVNDDAVVPINFTSPEIAQALNRKTRSGQQLLFNRFEEKRYFQGYRHFSLGGRATHVIFGKCPEFKPALAAKLSWRELSRTSEGAFIQKAWEYLGRIKAADVCEYLPTLYYDKEFSELSTDKIRIRLGIPLDENATRAPYFVILPKYEPITSRTSNWKAFYDDYMALIYCHSMLWSVGIEHRDISVSNLMWDPTTKKPKLCDFDLSHFSSSEKPAGVTNTGTWMFMSLELLFEKAMRGEIKRRYRHDLESFVAVLVWIVLCCEEGVIKNKDALARWNSSVFETCRNSREESFTDLSSMPPLTHIPLEIWWTVVRAAHKSLAILNEKKDIQMRLNMSKTMTLPGIPALVSAEEKQKLDHLESIYVLTDFLDILAHDIIGSNFVSEIAKKIKARLLSLPKLKNSKESSEN